MTSIKISIKPTSNDHIVKFEANEFLTQHQSFEFSNIDEAKPSPLAQQLFYLPFVKKVYISGNFIAVERYDIVQWSDVQNEVAKQIESFVNSGGIIINNKQDSSSKKVPATVYAESTPNPSVMKFVANKKLVLQSVEFNSIDDSKSSPFASELFHFPFVKSIFIDENFVSITKYDVAEWADITMEIREFVRNYIENAKPILVEKVSENTHDKEVSSRKETIELDDTSKQIVDILDEYIKPAVASDGGNIEFVSFDSDTKNVKVLLQGACSGCPSSTFTLKNGIENMLREMLSDKDIIVDAING